MRWVRRVAVGLAVIVLLVVGVVYAGSAWLIHRSYAAPFPQIAADHTPAGVSEGHRVAQTVGCLGCHGERGQGRVIADIPGVIHIAPPALPEAIMEACKGALANFKHPHEVRLVKDMPRSTLEKVAKAELRKLLKA